MFSFLMVHEDEKTYHVPKIPHPALFKDVTTFPKDSNLCNQNEALHYFKYSTTSSLNSTWASVLELKYRKWLILHLISIGDELLVIFSEILNLARDVKDKKRFYTYKGQKR